MEPFFGFGESSHGLLICTLISESQGFEKSRPVSNPRKISGSAILDLFSGLAPGSFQVYSIGWRPERFAEPEIFLVFEIDLDFSIP